MDSTNVEDITVFGLHDQQSVSLRLRPGLNVVHGKNGTGKTTLLHVLANLAERDVERFCYLRFDRIVVTTLAGASIVLRQLREGHDVRIAVTVDGAELETVTRGAETPLAVSKLLAERLGGRPVYLPAFRAVLEAVSTRRNAYHRLSPHEEESVKSLAQKEAHREQEEAALDGPTSNWTRRFSRERSMTIAYKTLWCRQLFGAFVPVVRCPSLSEVSEQIAEEIRSAQLNLAAVDRRGAAEVFVNVLTAVVSATKVASVEESVETLLGRIRKRLVQLSDSPIPTTQYASLSELVNDQASSFEEMATVGRILHVYDQALAQRLVAQEAIFRRIKTFEGSVNQFLEGKQLDIAAGDNDDRWIVSLGPSPVRRRAPLSVLSSGERQVLTLLFSATHMSAADGILLIDEPELSMHLDWQRGLLRELMRQAGARQVVVCTHAPELMADHRDATSRLGAEPWILSTDGLANEELRTGDDSEDAE